MSKLVLQLERSQTDHSWRVLKSGLLVLYATGFALQHMLEMLLWYRIAACMPYAEMPIMPLCSALLTAVAPAASMPLHGCSVQCCAYLAYVLAERYDSLAFFSSIGPTSDGRYKPDVIAPGTTMSARPAP